MCLLLVQLELVEKNGHGCFSKLDLNTEIHSYILFIFVTLYLKMVFSIYLLTYKNGVIVLFLRNELFHYPAFSLSVHTFLLFTPAFSFLFGQCSNTKTKISRKVKMTEGNIQLGSMTCMEACQVVT